MVSSSLWSVLLRNRPLRVLRVLKVLRLLRVVRVVLTVHYRANHCWTPGRE
jgi:hypothetical protein